MRVTLIPNFEPTHLFDDQAFVDILFPNKLTQPINFKLDSSRVTFGFVVISNKFCHVHYKYLDTNSKPQLIIDIYGLDQSENLIRERRHKLECGYSCGNVSGKIVQINSTTCKVVIGDLCNYLQVKVIEFTLESICELYDFNWSEIDYNINEVYFLNKNMILVSDVVGFNTNCIGIRVQNLSDQSILGKSIVLKTDYTHKYTDKSNELESSIIQVIENKYVLIKIKLINTVDVFKIIEKNILVLVDVIEGHAYTTEFDPNLKYAYTIELNPNSKPNICLLKLI